LEPSGSDWTPAGAGTPNASRIKDYYLGGKDHYAADRAKAEQLEAQAQAHGISVREMVKVNRAFTLKAVTWTASMLGAGQFLVLDCGLPSRPAVHEAARNGHPDARVVYADSDPVVYCHLAALQNGHGLAAVQADAADPALVLREARDLLDFTEPVCVVLGGTLSAMDAGVARAAVAAYAEALAPGSAVIISCITYADREFGDRMAGMSGGQWRNHSREEVAGFFAAGGLRLVHGRVMDVACWPACPLEEPVTGGQVLGGIGIKD
jgi:hypothetical protein